MSLTPAQKTFMNGKEETVWDNHTQSERTTCEVIGQILNIDISDYIYSDLKGTEEDLKNSWNQVPKLINKLRFHPSDRGAVLINNASDCIVLWQFFIRNDLLKCIVYLRSSDLDRKWKSDMELTHSLMQHIAKKLDTLIDKDVLTIQGSAHIYTD